MFLFTPTAEQKRKKVSLNKRLPNMINIYEDSCCDCFSQSQWIFKLKTYVRIQIRLFFRTGK